MNLAIMDPFGPQIPDTIDATICFPFQRYTKVMQREAANGTCLRSCMSVTFDPQGNYLAAIHSDRDNILVPTYDFKSRTLSSCCRIDLMDPHMKQTTRGDDATDNRDSFCTSWSYDSKTLLLAHRGSRYVFFINNTHRFGPELASSIALVPSCLNNLLSSAMPTNGTQSKSQRSSKNRLKKTPSLKEDKNAPKPPNNECESGDDDSVDYAKGCNIDVTQYMRSITFLPPLSDPVKQTRGKASLSHQVLAFHIPTASSGTVQIHPGGTGGLVCLEDGGLILVQLPKHPFDSATSSTQTQTDSPTNLYYYLLEAPLECAHHENGPEFSTHSYYVTCATFAENGTIIYAATSCGTFLAFKLSTLEQSIFRGESIPTSRKRKPDRIIKVPDDPTVRQIVVSRNSKWIVLNSLDGVLRLYSNTSIWNHVLDSSIHDQPSFPVETVHPIQIFQEAVSVIKLWVDCDFSGDSEFFISGCNNINNGGKYEINVWDKSTGLCIEKLVGPQVELLSLSCHPNRPFIAVGTSDGILDIWGTKSDWKAFAPSFQALERNVVYMESEHEFDMVIDRDEKESCQQYHMDMENEEEIVDILDVEPINGKMDEGQPFYFDIAICGRNQTTQRNAGNNY